MRSIASHFSVFLLLGLLASASTYADTSPSIADRLDGIDGEVAQAMQELYVPGAAVGVIVDGKVIYAKGYGVRTQGESGAVDADTIFAVGSISKGITTTAMATLIDEGKLDWDKPVREYLPWFALADSTATQLVTPRDLVTHRAGLASHDFLRWSTYLAREELVKRLRYLEPNRSFRDSFQYNNLAYTAAGFLAGDIAHSTWESLVQQRIFSPLGMLRSNTSAEDTQKLDNYAKPHAIDGGKLHTIDFYDYQRFGVGANGGVNSTVNDLLRYAQMQLDDGKFGGKQIVSAAQIRELHRAVVVAGDDPNGTRDYALGWFITQHRGHRFVEHSGSINGFTAQLILDLQTRAGIVVLNNLSTPLPQIIGWSIADRLLGLAHEDSLKRYQDLQAQGRVSADKQKQERLAARVANTHPSLALSAYAGTYFHPAYGPIKLRVDGNDLIAQFDAQAIRLKHYHYDVFECVNPYVNGLAQFRLNSAGRAAELLLPVEAAAKPLVFVRRD